MIAIIAPYKANVKLIERPGKKEAVYHKLATMSAASAVDSFQGKERDIVVVVMGTTEKSGAGFTMDKHRLNVMFSRQKSGLVVFGDHDVMLELLVRFLDAFAMQGLQETRKHSSTNTADKTTLYPGQEKPLKPPAL